MSRRGILIAAACLAAAGCGYIGDPLPPLANIPEKIQDLRAVQRGGNLIVQFTIPTRTTENMFIRSGLKLDLRAGPAPSSTQFNADAWASDAKRIPPVPLTSDLAIYTIPAEEWTGKVVTIAAHAIGSTGRSSGWSNFVNVTVVPAPAAPSNVHLLATATGVRLDWQGSAGGFRVFRRAADQEDYIRAGETNNANFTDGAAEFGKQYWYQVQRVVKLPGGGEAESELSAALSITPLDTFPPAAPGNIRTVAGTSSVELAWDRNTEADLAGYRVYRSAPGGELQKVADALELPAWSDRNIESGKTYRYAITAFDQAGNESIKSAITEVAVP